MFDRILSFLKDLPAGDKASGLEEDDPRVAAAALLIHVMTADGICSEDERVRLKSALSRAYNVSGAELKTLMKAAEEAEADAVDLYAFTSVLKRNLDEEARAEFVRLMWEVVFSDGELHELEDNLVWRVAELIGVDSRTRVTMRQEVRAKGRREGDG
ncbi:TerB family tellurite resistance protein [Chelativorans sp. AA-79]|uniref:tellurite resistance TerB family protein n=1 Tax=Chelativorans sp. AA-79 TaxID=3028735 RepID=UPI0023F90F61|nr:TerB family tellurite resistance protein [Chelativorans sp. AA-79]WEX09970.1 TerB family tellurite resistance protein [Chelativorans sp. AA-79]